MVEAVLVAVAIPVFTGSLNKSKAATDEANARALYGQLVADYLDDNTVNATINGSIAANSTVTVTGDGVTTEYKFSDQVSAGSINTTGVPSVSVTTYTGTFTFGGSSN